jgi:Zn-dependent protease
MPQGPRSSFRLFHALGVNVYLHYTWIFVALYDLQSRTREYDSQVWNVAEYLALFGIVLVHEYGHALATRQVGGTADTILLWPFGGIAYVRPPQRPGAELWSIAAGPLVNVGFFFLLTASTGLFPSRHELFLSDSARFLANVWWINLLLLLFNLLPIYPLDGGQILRALLWFVLGRGLSLFVATLLGFVGILGLVAYGIEQKNWWLFAIAAYAGLNCARAFKQAQALRSLERLPRRTGFACPSCRTPPPTGALWTCNRCSMHFDTFETGGTCPKCGLLFPDTSCLNCGATHPLEDWRRN